MSTNLKQQLATIRNGQAWLPFIFSFMAEKASDGFGLFMLCDVIMKCKLTLSTESGFHRGSFVISGIFVCERKKPQWLCRSTRRVWKVRLKLQGNTKGFIKCKLYILAVKLLRRRFHKRCDGQLILPWLRWCRYKEMSGTSVRLLMWMMKTDSSRTHWF